MGYRHHKRMGGRFALACQPCRDAWAEYQRDLYLRRKKAKENGQTRVPRGSEKPPCGTVSGYKWHRKNGENPCADCLGAKAEYKRSLRSGKGVSVVPRQSFKAAAVLSDLSKGSVESGTVSKEFGLGGRETLNGGLDVGHETLLSSESDIKYTSYAAFMQALTDAEEVKNTARREIVEDSKEWAAQKMAELEYEAVVSRLRQEGRPMTGSALVAACLPKGRRFKESMGKLSRWAADGRLVLQEGGATGGVVFNLPGREDDAMTHG